MARISDQIPLGVLKPPMQAGVNSLSRYLSQNRVMLILTASWSAIILIAVMAMLSLLNPAAVNPIPSPTPELPVERPPAVAPTEPNPTAFENPRALWSLFMAMAAAGCMAGALIILLGLRRALIQNGVFSTAKAHRVQVSKFPNATKPTPVTAPFAGLGQPHPSKASPKSPKSTGKASQPRSPKAVSPVPAGVPHPAPRPASVPLHLVPPSAPGPFAAADSLGTPPAAPAQRVPLPPKRPKGAKTKAKARPSSKPLAQPPVVVFKEGASAINVPAAPPSVPKVASLQKAAQQKVARKRARKSSQKPYKPSKSGHQATPPPILSSLQAGVTIVPAEESHPLDWHEQGIAEAMDIRKRRPLSSLMMRRR
ncbi:hypothetical protein OOK60_02725 [Trichothermofontia sichuanensis B231]|uniref:hypothetical protein n=1 Tax=Trichothermofontia sichuanensis TaxID=3045816 RepID=UPI0022471B52|nr:hypothetical protein [Trichothermofontia sichuanensis]UZQ55011.1 hypothetical protein OOK60_02725 [Trichothermofontia sichuanensis B231]